MSGWAIFGMVMLALIVLAAVTVFVLSVIDLPRVIKMYRMSR